MGLGVQGHGGGELGTGLPPFPPGQPSCSCSVFAPPPPGSPRLRDVFSLGLGLTSCPPGPALTSMPCPPLVPQ